MGLPKPTLTEGEYLKLERASLERHQYVDGEIFAMAGETPAHGDITSNVNGILYVQLRGTPCRARIKDTKVRSGPLPRSPKRRAGLYSYPDIVVICGEPKYLDEHQDVILNPKVIVEVLSASTEAFDRGRKLKAYRKYNPSLTDYVLISQDSALIEHFYQEKNGKWIHEIYEGIGAIVKIESIHCQLAAVDVYERIEFEADDDS
jgi:Uma2 family endonuclease